MTFVVNGANLMPYIEQGGLQFQFREVEGGNGGTLKNGDTLRDVIAIKCDWSAKCRPLTGAELAVVLTAIKPENVTARITDPQSRVDKDAVYYPSGRSSTLTTIYADGGELYNGLSFSLKQK